MVDAESLDLEPLLAPISEDAPTGVPLRREDGTVDPDYDKVKTAAQEARSAERAYLRWRTAREEDSRAPDPPNWRIVETEALRVLRTKSKDLWVAAWLIEALVRTRGFVGLRDGLQLTRELVERYWDQLHPLPGEDDDESPIEFKVSQIAGLNGDESDGVLIAPLRSVELVHSDEYGPLSYWDYSIASKISTDPDPNSRERKLQSAGTAPLEEFERSMLQTPPSELQARCDAIREALAEVARLDDVLTARCVDEDGNNYAPSMATIRSVLEDCATCVELYLKRVSPGAGEESGEEGAAATGEEGEEGAAAANTSASVSAGRLQTREDAFRALLQVSDFFRRTEPHSPVSYALEQAVRWGRMPLPELLRELISDESVRNDVFRRTGIPKPPDSSDDEY